MTPALSLCCGCAAVLLAPSATRLSTLSCCVVQVLNNCMNELIAQAKATRNAEDVEALQSRDYSKAGLAEPVEGS